MLRPACVEAIGDANVCYILDGILVMFGAILTILFCRLKMNDAKTTTETGGIYEDLAPRGRDIYETINTDKKPIE
ncbi:unnamed protein product [Tetraodon nigroviridis]|uniref:Chromosome undetermined SCAF10112, whole genome shotgun sequence n=1 Tax=Tetraodon nigroviridis TaxID=99883 RepID=Q4T375_TETNG|nr:unnamed protein product [Tetraodon nigroviridis]